MKYSSYKVLTVSLAAGLMLSTVGRAGDVNTNSTLDVSVTPEATYAKVSGNAQKFREDVGIRNGWSGGIEDATLHEDLGKDTTLDGEGRFILDDHDYKLRLQLTKKDVGFVRGGFTEYREYYDNEGGFFHPFTPSSFQLNNDLGVNEGSMFVEAGLTLPNLPKVTLGYEHQFRNGEESLLEWGGVTQGTDTRKIYPSFKGVHEFTDILKLGAEYDISKVHLRDDFRYEHFSMDDNRADTSVNLNTSSSQTVTVHENNDHDAFYNTFLMDSHVNDKVYWSVGYLYSSLHGNGNMQVATPPPVGPFGNNWTTSDIDLDLYSHVVNFNIMLGPFKGLVVYSGLQAEKTETHGFTDALLTQGAGAATTNLIHTANDTKNISESMGMRYTKIPYTTLYAEGRWEEEQVDLNEAEAQNGASSLALGSDATSFRQDYRAGFNTSPLPRVSLSGRYRYYLDHGNYDYDNDTVTGYPGFITAQSFTTDEAMGKLTLRPCSRFSTSFTYQRVTTDIRTSTEAVPLIAPGGTLQSGDYDANIYSVSATVTPMSRWYLTGYFSLQDTRTAAFANHDPAVTKYRGNVYTVMGTSGYAIDDKTDFTLEYSYSRSDNFTDNSSAGLPLGLNFERHAVQAGISRKIHKNVTAHLRYGFYSYDESSTGGINNYIAHLASASCTVRF
jgi:hypothetical protein